MRILFTLPLLLALAVPAMAAEKVPPPSAKLTEALKGRVAEKPRSCITLRPTLRSQIIDETAIIYEDTSRLWYVNRPDHGSCTSLRRDRAIVTRTPTNQLCRGDIVRVIDPPSPMEFGSCVLGDFVPYRKVK
ncbi:hypothetical protein CLG96_10270 [Sphingomonas oleivorans]|uniref:Uncharacterized protein n=1 Tax=Sphingomonas oleivorans TaxID=1735121 RepID=A0A2T5FXC0_9SPHN|nr:hypothetical protein [Sphingomonas oleivorans]PTQ10781.1 hypothetical protein CLG96_10270 [Sphingomonas oleivorans]